jgi:hypothetical protein
MGTRVPLIGEFVSTRSRGLVDIANVDPDLVYLDDSPNRPIPISNLRHSPMDRQDIWVIITEAGLSCTSDQQISHPEISE